MTHTSHQTRILCWAFCLLTSLMASVIQTVVWRWTGLDLFSFSYLVLLPIGALVMGFIALSGFYLGATSFKYQPDRIDFSFLLVAALAFALQIFLGMYLSLYLMGRLPFPDMDILTSFISFYVTEAKHTMHFNRQTSDTVAAGGAGWYLLMVQIMALCAVARTIYGATDRSGNAQWESKY
ncbi:hypothetical protein [Undibacterium sp. TS12]|uniref:hypothetical protein n=1 Tax=Undibacterium sp. TS12 TaxID=2908202 RepID=UPI001F4CD4E9|nr:hypothetical protein [Undibacterium sp. TS12]MCH8617514.1 hypothetical protein [Undibacterium sp. TS12]